MRFSCPNCGEVLSLNALIEHAGAREALKLALEFPAPLGKQLIQYVSLFKPEQRMLSMDRFAKLLGELLPMIQAAQIERNGRIWTAPQAYWSQALDTVVAQRHKLTLPLKSHGYLLEIIVGMANKAEGYAEKKAEQGRKYGEVASVAPTFTPSVNTETKTKKPRSEMPADVRATLHKLTGKGKKNADSNQA